MDIQSQAAAALSTSVNALVGAQDIDGGWPGQNFAGPAYTAMCLAVESYLGVLSDHDKREGPKYCRSCQLDDGSYPDYPSAPEGSLNTTALVYAALSLCGVGASDDCQQKALNFIVANGGFDKASYEYRLYLAMAGLFDAQRFKDPSVLFKLVPFTQRLIGRRFGLEMAIAANELPLMIRLLKYGPGLRWWTRPLHALACKLAYRYLMKTQNPEGNWAGILMPTLWAMMAMRYVGVSESSEQWQRTYGFVQTWKVYDEQGMRVVPYQSRVWNTALSVRALLFSQQDAAKASILKGLAFLQANQSFDKEPLSWQNPAPHAPRFGGWPYEQYNQKCSDCDTTAAVLWTLAEAQKQGYDIQQDSINHGLAWLKGMQNPDGGWSAFCHGLKSKPPGPIMTKPLVLPEPTMKSMANMMMNPPVELGDPSTAGLTGRVLSALRALEIGADDAIVNKAATFLAYQSTEQGIWWGRWEVNFLAASACAINGLSGFGKAISDQITVPAQWMATKQNPDGGWGEAIQSYAKPELAGQGESCGTITADVVIALMNADKERYASQIKAGIQYLVKAQQIDGFWQELYPLFVMMPPNTFYTNRIYAQYSPVAALSQYLNS